MSDNEKQQGLIFTILEGMHPTVKAITFSMLAIPIVVALSAMILQVNAGAIITKMIDSSLDKQTAEIQREYVEQMQSLRSSIEPLYERVGLLEDRMSALESESRKHLEWSCDITSPQHREEACHQLDDK